MGASLYANPIHGRKDVRVVGLTWWKDIRHEIVSRLDQLGVKP
jgi:hypothetical protein